MIILYMCASFAGAGATIVALWSYSWTLALLCAPLGASALALIIAVLVALRPRSKEIVRSEPARMPSGLTEAAS
jgi:hypothetical protein